MPEQEQETTQSIQPEVVSETQRNKSPLKVVLLVVLGLVIVAGAVYTGMQIGKKQVVGELVQKVTPTPIPQPTGIPTLDETANWKTYTNQKYYYQVRYPQFLILKEEPPTEDFLSRARFNNPSETTIGFNVEVRESSIDEEIERIKKAHESMSIVWHLESKSEISHNGFKGVKLVYVSEVVEDKITIVVLSREQYSYSLTFQNMTDIIDQILSTFKFLE